MTRGAIENAKLRQSDLENRRNIEQKKKELEDKATQRKFDAEQKRKDRINKIFTSGMGLLKLPKFNDPNFYKQFVPDVDRFTNLSTFQRLGQEQFTKYGLINRAFIGSNVIDYANPGVLVIGYVPTTGPQNSAISTAQNYPINQALNRTKEQVLKSSSRSSVNWEGADVGLNIFCTADIFTALHEIKRVLLIYQTYKGDNSYLANTYIRSLGWDYSDVAANAVQYRKDLLVLAAKFNSSIVAPADIALYHRRAYLIGNIFADRKGVVKQAYMFRQLHYHVLNAAGDGTTIHDLPMMGGVTQLSTFIGWVNAMIESITANPDYVEMYADLRASISNLLTFDGTIDPNATIEYNSEDLNREQLHNLKTLPYSTTGYATTPNLPIGNWGLHINSAGYLYQGSSDEVTKRNAYWPMTGYTTDQVNAFKQFLTTMFSHSTPKVPVLLDMDKDDINGDDILEITRGLYDGYQSTSSQGTTLEIYSCGTELFVMMQAWGYNYTQQSMTSIAFGSYMVGQYSIGNPINNMVASMYSKFDWAPMVNYFTLNDNQLSPVTDDNIILASASLFDLNHAFCANGNDIDKLNEICVLSEFYLTTQQFRR